MAANHQPWDNGAIDAAFVQVFGVGARTLTAQKTVKAHCGKRVPVAQAIAGQPITCWSCNEALNAEKEFVLEQAVALNATNILRSIAERTLDHAREHISPNGVRSNMEADEILLVAQEQVIAEQIAALGI